MIGFSLAIAVFFDAFVVRMAIVPAVLALLGKRAWWLPRWLDRTLPSVNLQATTPAPINASPIPTPDTPPAARQEPEPLPLP